MVTYEWEAEDNLGVVLADEKWGQQLPKQHRLPLLVIPLTVHSAFFIISANLIAVCRDGLHLPAEFADFLMDVHESSAYYHGNGMPLWTAWTRPYRLPTYQATRDNIYLAREDGVFMFLEIDSDNILGASVQIGKFDCSIGTSFCSLLDAFNDILIMGGDSGPGIICQIRPRKPNIKIGEVPNWSPVLDFASSDKFSSAEQVLAAVENNVVTPWQASKPGVFSLPDRIFTTSGRGVTGCITELRYGYRANIAMDLNPNVEVKEAWIFWTNSDGADVGYHLLLSLADRSAGLHLTPDLDQIFEPDAEKIPYDLTSRTITALQLPCGDVVQVTDKSLVYTSPKQSRALRLHTDTFQNAHVRVLDASIDGSRIALSTTIGVSFQVHLLDVSVTGAFSLVKSFDQAAEVTCLHLATLRDSPYIVTGLLQAGKPTLFLCKADEETTTSWTMDLNSDEESRLRSCRRKDGYIYSPLEPLSSVCLLREGGEDKMAVAFGTRGGDMGVVVLGPSGKATAMNSIKLGTLAVYLSFMESEAFPRGAVLALCDGRLHQMSGLEAWRATFETLHMVWLEDVSDSRKASPFLSSLTMLHGALPGKRKESSQFVLTSNTRILAAELHVQPGPVHRSFPVAGTPLIVLYSHMLDCLVVALKTLDNRATIQFIDPDTGEDLSVATDQFNEPVPFASGLGRVGDEILGLAEWKYERNGDAWLFVLVGTKYGRMLVLSMGPTTRDRYGQREKIRYWTRYRKTPGRLPVYSVMGWDSNVFYCMGTTIYWDRLNLEDRRLETQGTFELSSIATSLRILNGRLVALTDGDSMEIISIDNDRPGEMSLHHGDIRPQNVANIIEIGDQSIDASGMFMSGILLSNRNFGMSGLCVPWQRPGSDCNMVFEADLPGSVRKLVRGRIRPIWQQAQREVLFGMLPSTPDGVDIMGMCVDGSLLHFTFLSRAIWRVLRLVQNLAFVTPTLYPFGYELPGPEFNEEPTPDHSFGMQIDGDMLKRCLKKRALERLFDRPSRVNYLIHYLDELDGGRWTADIRGEDTSMSEEEEAKMYAEKKARYLALTYEVLEYFVSPVM